MILNREDLGFRMKVIYGGHFEGACGSAEGGVLDRLKSIDFTIAGVREPNGAGVSEK